MTFGRADVAYAPGRTTSAMSRSSERTEKAGAFSLMPAESGVVFFDMADALGLDTVRHVRLFGGKARASDTKLQPASRTASARETEVRP
jgi:hypothetical protein